MTRDCRFMRIAPGLVFMPGLPILPTTHFIGGHLRDALDPRPARQGASNP